MYLSGQSFNNGKTSLNLLENLMKRFILRHEKSMYMQAWIQSFIRKESIIHVAGNDMDLMLFPAQFISQMICDPSGPADRVREKDIR